MDIHTNVPLAQYSTMRLGGPAAYLAEVHNANEVIAAVDWAAQQKLPVLVIGDGSNIVWRDEGYSGLVLVNKIMGYSEQPTDEVNTFVVIGAGEHWDSVVERTVKSGLSGIEALSLVPGTAGATPIQNVGAYGQEIANTLISIDAYDTRTRQMVTIPAAECQFGYRTSRFKTADRGRFIILSITLHLKKVNPEPPFYRTLAEYLSVHHTGKTYTPDDIRKAVIHIRSNKLPDPLQVANNGSFFANPIIPTSQYAQLAVQYPEMPHWPTEDPNFTKIPAAWLIEQAGFKDFHDSETGMATWSKQPLVLINEHATATSHLLAFKQRIVLAVHAKFHITLEQEPELLP